MDIADAEKETLLHKQTTPKKVEGNTTVQEPTRAVHKGSDLTPSTSPITETKTVQKPAQQIRPNYDTGTTEQEPVAETTETKTGIPETRYDLAGKTLQKSSDLGLAANRALQNAEIPKLKRQTIKDIITNPEYEGIRDSIVANHLGAVGANFLTGKNIADSELNKFNRQQAERYSSDVAERDKQATAAQLDAINAANKRDIGEELQWADTVAGREMDRWGLMYDTDTKKQILDKMIKDSQTFNEQVPNAEDRAILTAYQQYLSGDATALDSLITTYGIKGIEKLGQLVDWLTNTFTPNGDGEEDKKYPDTQIGDKTYTLEELVALDIDGVDEILQGLPYEEQIEAIDRMEANYEKSKFTKTLRQKAEEREKASHYGEEQIRISDERADSLADEINVIENSGYTAKQKRDKLIALKGEIDRQIERGKNDPANGYVETQKLKTARANLNNRIAKAKLAIEVEGVNTPIKKNVNLAFDKNDNLKTDDADSSLKYLAKLNWYTNLIVPYTQSVSDRADKLDAVRGTDGYQSVITFLSNPKVQEYATSNNAAKSNYKYAVSKFLSTFGGTAKDYGFIQF